MSDPGLTDECDRLQRLAALPELLGAVASEAGTELQIQARLRANYPADLVRMALEVVALRKAAAGKFIRASELWLSRKGLEQSTPEAVACHKAQRFAAASGDDPVWDLCCGIGGDAMALAQVRSVVAVDVDPANLLRVRLNVAAHGGAERLETMLADVTTVDVAGRLVHIDPDRRGHGERTLRLEQYQPPLPWLQELVRTARGGAIKVSPASNFGGKFADVEIELVSLQGECKEATIWFGELRGTAPWRATVLPAGATIAGHPLDAPTVVRSPGAFLFDPDPAVVRSGLVDLLAEQAGLWRLDEAEEYLSGNELVASPFCTAFAIEEIVANNPREIRQAVRARGWGQVEIKCRHVPVDADAVRRKLPLEGAGTGVLLFARMEGRTRAVLAQRVSRPN